MKMLLVEFIFKFVVFCFSVFLMSLPLWRDNLLSLTK